MSGRTCCVTQRVTSPRMLLFNCNTFTQQHLKIKKCNSQARLLHVCLGEISLLLPSSLAVSLSCSLLLFFSFCLSLTGRNYRYYIKRELFQLFQKILLMIYETCSVKKEKKQHYILLFCVLPLKKNHSYLPFAIAGLLNFPSATVNLRINTFFSLPYLETDNFNICNTSKIYSNYRKILKEMKCKYDCTTNGILILKQIICDSHYTISN